MAASLDPLVAAKDHHRFIISKLEGVAAHAANIAHLLRGRQVRLISTGRGPYVVTEIRVKQGAVYIFGKSTNARRHHKCIATSLDQIEIIPEDHS